MSEAKSQEVLTPEVVDDVVDLTSTAIEYGLGSEKFDVTRKLAALLTLLVDETISAETAAIESDAAVMEKSLDYKVGKGEITEAEALEMQGDRKSSAFVSTCRTFLAEAVEFGCEAIGTTIGSFFGHPMAGYSIGTMVAKVANKPVREIATIGARKIQTWAKRAWDGIKEVAKKVGDKVRNAFKSVFRV